MTTVKITELTNIGANLATSTLVPVVNMAGTPTTQKTTVGNIANLILEGAGVDYPEASVALLAQTVSNAAQPNITSTGTLTGLTVSGNTNLGAIANVRITGGTSGYVLSTDGAGNLSWAAGGGGGSYGNSNVAAYLPTYTGNIGANIISANLFVGSGANLTNLAGGNVTGAVPYATTANLVAGANVSGAVNYASIANSVAGVNVSGQVSFAATANSVAAANVSGLGNIATINLDGNISNALLGNGAWGPVEVNVNSIYNGTSSVQIPSSNGNVSVNVGSNSWVFTTDGDVHLPGNSYLLTSGELGFLVGTNTVFEITTSNSANYSWFFNPDGSLQIPEQLSSRASIFSKDSNSNTTSFITFPTASSSNLTLGTNDTRNVVISTDHSNANLRWVFDNTGDLTVPGDLQFADGTVITDNLEATGNFGITTPANVGFMVDTNAGTHTWTFNSDGTTFFPTLTTNIHNGGNQSAQTLQFGDASQQVIITGPTPNVDVAAQRIIIQGQAGNGTGEGGDVYVWAGDADTNGGDIKIYAGDADGAGYGGYINIDAGTGTQGGGQLTLTSGQSSNGSGGTIYITAGYSGNGAGAPVNINGGQSALDGGAVNITGGYGAGNAGNVLISGGQSSLGLPGYGNVTLAAGASSMTFNNLGVLNVPSLISTNSGTSNLVLAPQTGAGTANISVPTFQDGGEQLQIINDYSTGNGTLIRSNGNDWHFNTSGVLTLPYGAIIDPTDDNFEVRAIETVNFEANATFNIYTDTSNNGWQWQFDETGKFNLAGGGSIIESIANSSLDPTLPNVSTMVLTPDSNYGSQVLVLDPTAPGHIHLRAYASSNIDQPAANIFLGGEDTAFEVTSGSGNEARIHSGNNQWTFDNTGNLTIPGTSGGFIKTIANSSIGIAAMDNGTNNPAQLLLIDAGSGNAETIISAYNSNATIQTNASGTIHTWSFDDVGDLTLPGSLIATSASPAPVINGFSVSNAVSIGGGNITTTGTITSTGKIGYSTGANATQSTSGAGVTINQLTGLVTLATRTYNAGDLEAFSISCNKISANDFVLVQMVDSVNAPSYNVVAYPNYVLANTISVLVKTLETVGSDTPILKFMIVKAPVA